MFPMGGFGETHSGHKGYGLSLLVEIMCAVLSGGLTANYVRVDPAVDRVCHFFMAVDYGMFGDKAEIEANLTKYLNELRDSRKAEGSPRIYTHGDKAYENMAAVSQKGIKVNDKTYEEMTGIAKELGIPYEDYLIEK